MSDSGPAVVLITIPMALEPARELFTRLGRALEQYEREAAGDAQPERQ